MALKTLVKVGNISNLSDARYCAGMGVDMLGFSVVEGQDHYVSPILFKEIRGWFTGPTVVAEAYGITSNNDLSVISQHYAPDFIELSMTEFKSIKPESGNYILFITSDDWKKDQSDILLNKKYIAYLLVPADTTSDILQNLSGDFNVIVKVDSTNNIDTLLESGVIKGISLQGGSEEKPGLKNYDQLSEIFEKLEIDN